jgi:hypothetical protein
MTATQAPGINHHVLGVTFGPLRRVATERQNTARHTVDL